MCVPWHQYQRKNATLLNVTWLFWSETLYGGQNTGDSNSTLKEIQFCPLIMPYWMHCIQLYSDPFPIINDWWWKLKLWTSLPQAEKQPHVQVFEGTRLYLWFTVFVKCGKAVIFISSPHHVTLCKPQCCTGCKLKLCPFLNLVQN